MNKGHRMQVQKNARRLKDQPINGIKNKVMTAEIIRELQQ